MWVKDMYDQNACSIFGRNNWCEVWTWQEYAIKKEELKDLLVLVDMINHPIDWSIAISDELFNWKYKDWTTFALYCHSWGSSAYLQKQLIPIFPQYRIINIKGWILAL